MIITQQITVTADLFLKHGSIFILVKYLVNATISKTCNEPAQEAASGETGVDPDSCMNRSAYIYVRAYVCDKLLRVQNTNRACMLSAINKINKKKGKIGITRMWTTPPAAKYKALGLEQNWCKLYPNEYGEGSVENFQDIS